MKNVSFIERKEELFKRYGHLLDGVQHFTNNEKLNRYEQNKLMVMLDNAENAFCGENRIPIEKLREATTLSTDASVFVKTQLPLIRKVYPAMISRELVSVQPMTQPTTKIFYYDILRDDGSSLSAEIDDQRDYANNEEYDPADPMAIKEIVMRITDTDVSATEKKLKAVWTVESEQDIMAYHGIEVEGDLSDNLSSEIVREWDRDILHSLLDGATGGASTFDQSEPAGLGYEERKYWMETFYDRLIDIDTQIFKKTYRKTNWIVIPADIAGFIEKMAGFKADSVSVEQKVIATGGRYFMGTLNNRWRCYCDPFFPSTKVLMGYNNPGSWMDTACVFSPYILSYFSPTFVDPTTFKKVRAILSRAARKVVRGDLLGVLTVSGS